METTNGEQPVARKKPVPPTEGRGRKAGVRQVKRTKRLIDMQRVYDTEKGGEEHPEDTPGQASFRRFLREDAKGFLALMNKMATDYAAKKERVEKEERAKEKAGPSEGTKQILDIIEQLFKEWDNRD